MEIAYEEPVNLFAIVDSLILISILPRLWPTSRIWSFHWNDIYRIFPIVERTEDISSLIDLFKTTSSECYSIDIALKLASLVNSVHCSDAQAQEIWNLLLPFYGCELTKGRHIWAQYRADIMRREPDSPERAGKILETFQQQLAVPLHGMDETFADLQCFCHTHRHSLSISMISMNLIAKFEKAKQTVATLEVFEKQLEIGENAINEMEANERISGDLKQQIRSNLEKEIVNTFSSYITFCTGNIILPPEGIMTLYERMTLMCPSQVTPVGTYLVFLINLIGSGYRSSHNFCKTIFDVIERGMRQFHPVQQAIESSILNALIHYNMTPQVNCLEVLEFARTFCCNSGEDLVANIIVAYLSKLIRITDIAQRRAQFEEKFNTSWTFFLAIHGKSEEDTGKRQQLWEKAAENTLFK